MARYTPDKIRNIAILGHSHDGKTTLAEALLLASGAIQRLGSTEAGTATLDFEPEEQKHQISISAGIANLDWKGTKVNLIDCPGFADFVGEVVGALRAVEAAMVVVAANSGVAVGTESAPMVSWADQLASSMVRSCPAEAASPSLPVRSTSRSRSAPTRWCPAGTDMTAP